MCHSSGRGVNAIVVLTRSRGSEPGPGRWGGSQELRAFDERYWGDLALDVVADDGDWRAEVFKKHSQEP